MSAVLSLEPEALFTGRYRVERLLGEGGMGAVYEVTHLQTERRRALKVMLPSLISSKVLRSRFEREAKVGAVVHSEHIVEVIDAGVDEATGAPYFVMELLDGDDLAKVLERGGALEPAAVVRLLGQAALALDKAHQKGIVHRDLKPENLFVTTSEIGEPRLKILDFGIAKFVGDAAMHGQTQGMMGTPTYMAPEQVLASGDVTSAADIYALGQVAFTALSGEPYFAAERDQSDNVMQLVAWVTAGVRDDACARARRRRGIDLPPALSHWFERAAHVDPHRRFSSARELVEALADCLRLERPFRGAPATLLSAGVDRATGRLSRTDLEGSSTVVAAPAPEALHDELAPTIKPPAPPQPTLTSSAASLPDTPRPPAPGRRRALYAGAIAVCGVLVWIGIGRSQGSHVEAQRSPALATGEAPPIVPAPAAPRSSSLAAPAKASPTSAGPQSPTSTPRLPAPQAPKGHPIPPPKPHSPAEPKKTATPPPSPSQPPGYVLPIEER